jgi:hypothetical protein
MAGMDFETVAFLVAMIFPVFVVLRWRGFGFLIAVIFGWSIIHASNKYVTVKEPADGVFKGIWAVFGWAYMAIWCMFVGCFIAAIRWMTRKLWEPLSLVAQQNAEQ